MIMCPKLSGLVINVFLQTACSPIFCSLLVFIRNGSRVIITLLY